MRNFHIRGTVSNLSILTTALNTINTHTHNKYTTMNTTTDFAVQNQSFDIKF